jgi:hypothetical protein
MKKIGGYIVKSPDGQSVRLKLNTYSVFLKAGLKYLYSNRKEAEAYQNRLFYSLNRYSIVLNDLYINCFANYRRLWFYFDSGISDGNNIDTHLKAIQRSFDLLHSRQLHPGSGASAILNYFDVICNSMIKIYEIMSEKQKERNNYEAINNYSAQIYTIERIVFELNNLDSLIDPGNNVVFD